MSLVLVAYDIHPRYRLVAACNRDEFHFRDTSPAAWWDDTPDVLAGRDLDSGGSWFGIRRDGRFAAITGYRDPKSTCEGRRSRGLIVSDFLQGESSTDDSLSPLGVRSRDYNPFSVMMYDGQVLGWCSNRVRGTRRLGAGIYGLSNHLLNTPWHKVASGKSELKQLLSEDPIHARHLLSLLDARSEAMDECLPRTGVGEDCERWLSPRFVVGETFGTRASTVLLVSHDGEAELVERRFDAQGIEIATARYTFAIEHECAPRAAPLNVLEPAAAAG